jgi:hypothetical protein
MGDKDWPTEGHLSSRRSESTASFVPRGIGKRMHCETLFVQGERYAKRV